MTLSDIRLTPIDIADNMYIMRVTQKENNMIKKIHVCDKCGSETENDSLYWTDRTTTIQTKCPIDGVNGGLFKGELCNDCRRELHEILLGFFGKTVDHF